LLGAVAVLTVGNFVGIGFSPVLATEWPLLLIALSPLGRHLVLVAPVTGLAPFVAVATARKLMSSMLGFGLGRAYGADGLRWAERRYPRTGKFLRWLERGLAAAGPLLVVLMPGPAVCALAGVARMRASLVLPLATIGNVGWMTVTWHVGEALGKWILPILAWVQAHVWEATAVCVAAVLLHQWWRRRKRRAAVES
jgi:membrane protein DedA with SNARE-associated domain